MWKDVKMFAHLRACRGKKKTSCLAGQDAYMDFILQTGSEGCGDCYHERIGLNRAVVQEEAGE